MPGFKQIPLPVLHGTTDIHHERNIYVHPNPVARGIFWQRLRHGYRLISDRVTRESRVLDFGGGSGVFLPTLADHFDNVSVVDLDLDDARRIAGHFGLSNVRLLQRDIRAWHDDEQFDLITAMDVLEHFADMNVPLAFFERHLKPGGLLLVSLPTENILYEIGRRVVRKQKPADHYHPARKIVDFYRAHGYTLLDHSWVPRIGVFALPLFFIGVLRKHG